MGGASFFKKEPYEEVVKNLHSMVWSAGAAKYGCKKTKDCWLSVWKRALNLYRYKPVQMFCLELLWCQNKLEIQDCADRETNLEASEPVGGVTMGLPMAETCSS